MEDINLILGTSDLDGRDPRVWLSRAPHILVAGMTGAGKSVMVHDLICQFFAGRSPAQARLLLVDPKRCEFGIYKGLPNNAIEPVSRDDEVLSALNWAVAEMHDRFNRMEQAGWRDASASPWARLLVVIDELANLMLKGKDFERPIVEIASMGRAAGVHLLLATQRPDSTVINGLIRANVPTRVALPVITRGDSITVLDQPGAEDIRIPQRLIRLPGQRTPTLTEGRFWTDENIDICIKGQRRWWT